MGTMSRSSATPARGAAFFTYKGKPVDLRQIGRKLNVRYVLEGSVQRASQSAIQITMRPMPQEVIHNRASGINMKPHPASPNIRSSGRHAVANQF